MATLDDEEQRHIEEMRAIRRQRLRVIERQIEEYGPKDAPAHLLTERDNLRTELGIVGKMARGEFTDDFLEFMRQFGMQKSLENALTSLGNELYEFKKEYWTRDKDDKLDRKERQIEIDLKFKEIETRELRRERLQWLIFIAIVAVSVYLLSHGGM